VKRETVSLLAAATSGGLAIGWVCGSWSPWSGWALVVGMALTFAWLVKGHMQLNRDLKLVEELKEQAKARDDDV
jgi:hypothetical protein